jgi:hypothetical protein
MFALQASLGWQDFVCEFCAMRVCSKHNYDCMFWDLDARTPGLCTQHFDCGHRVNCPGQGNNPGFNKLEKQADARCSAHCPACKYKLDNGLKLWEPVSRPAGNATHTHTPSRSPGP